MRKHRTDNKRFSEKQIWRWAYEILLGIKYLHEKSILHRDIKSLNIFLTKSNKVKVILLKLIHLQIGDLGVSKIIKGTMHFLTTKIGTPLYMSPEQVKQKPYDFKVDIWGVGC